MAILLIGLVLGALVSIGFWQPWMSDHYNRMDRQTVADTQKEKKVSVKRPRPPEGLGELKHVYDVYCREHRPEREEALYRRLEDELLEVACDEDRLLALLDAAFRR